MTAAPFTTAAEARNFMNAGNSTVTLASKTTGDRITYKIQAPHKPGNEGTNAARDTASQMRFVKVLTGSDNENSYSYLGYIRRGVFFHGGAKTRIGRDAKSSYVFEKSWKALQQDVMPGNLEVWHEGRCARCARKLTVPSSIASGFGPECAQYAGVTAVQQFFAVATI